MTKISIFWFNKLKDITPTHFITANVDEMPEEVLKYKDQLEGRAMLVKKAKVIPLEAIVRGYLTGGYKDPAACPFLTFRLSIGSAWSEYKKSGTVHGTPMPSGLIESQKLPSPLFTPSTKAEQGEHDENISPQQGAGLVLWHRISVHNTTQRPPSSVKKFTVKCQLLHSSSTRLHRITR